MDPLNQPLNLFLWKLETKSIIIYGDPGSWKTQTAWLCTLWYTRIYSNVDFYKNWKRTNTPIHYMSDIKKMEFDEKPGILVLDEMWVNWNSRKSMSKDNIEFWKLGMLQRKFNLYVVWIAQQDFSFDKNQRLSAHLILHCRALEFEDKDPVIVVTRERVLKGSSNFMFEAERIINILKIQKILWYSYNQLDQSVIIWKSKTEDQKKLAEKNIEEKTEPKKVKKVKKTKVKKTKKITKK